MAESRRQNITKTVEVNSGGLFRFIRSRVPTAVDAEDILSLLKKASNATLRLGPFFG